MKVGRSVFYRLVPVVGLPVLFIPGTVTLHLRKARIALAKTQVRQITIDAMLIEMGDVGRVVKSRVRRQTHCLEDVFVALVGRDLSDKE